MFMTSNLLPEIQIQIYVRERGELNFKLNATKSAKDFSVLRRIMPKLKLDSAKGIRWIVA